MDQQNEKQKCFNEIVNARRSVRIFDSEKIPAAVIDLALENAMLAPNSSNLQPWEFYWVKSEEKKKELAQICLSQAGAQTASELIVCVARTKTWKKLCKYQLEQLEKLQSNGVEVPKAAFHYYRKIAPFAYENGYFNLLGIFKKLLFFFIGLKKPMIRGPASEKDLQIWAVKTTALACENFMLSIQASGYNSLPMEGFDKVRLHRLLGLASDAVTVMVIAVGKEKVGAPSIPRIRMNQNAFVKII